jgi:hypothetical protein
MVRLHELVVAGNGVDYPIRWDNILGVGIPLTGAAMSPKEHSTKRFRIIHSPTLTKLEDWKRFVEIPYFRAKWKSLGLTDDDLNALQIMIMMQPKGAPVVSGTGGLRKARFSPPGSGRGKRGAYRIGYAYFEEFGVVCLIAVYAKNDQENIPIAQRREIKIAIERLHEWIASGG